MLGRGGGGRGGGGRGGGRSGGGRSGGGSRGKGSGHNYAGTGDASWWAIIAVICGGVLIARLIMAVIRWRRGDGGWRLWWLDTSVGILFFVALAAA